MGFVPKSVSTPSKSKPKSSHSEKDDTQAKRGSSVAHEDLPDLKEMVDSTNTGDGALDHGNTNKEEIATNAVVKAAPKLQNNNSTHTFTPQIHNDKILSDKPCTKLLTTEHTERSSPSESLKSPRFPVDMSLDDGGGSAAKLAPRQDDRVRDNCVGASDVNQEAESVFAEPSVAGVEVENGLKLAQMKPEAMKTRNSDKKGVEQE